MQSSPIDLHIELSSLRNFVNEQIEQGNPFSFNGKMFYDILKRVILYLESKPFLSLPKDESERNYYDKYLRLSQEKFDILIPDFFEHKGEFYDLDRVQYAQKEFIGDDDFEKLFILKLLELRSNEYPIEKFLSFQQYDSFYGEKESIDSFLYQLTEKDSNCYLLDRICEEIKNWIDNENLTKLKSDSTEDVFSAQDEIPIQNSPSQIKWMKDLDKLKGKEIECKWDFDQIVHYFSFLYKEKSENDLPFLKKEEVDKMFEQGFRIPESDINPLFELNYSNRYPLKIIHFAIYQFNEKAGSRRKHKKEYFLFFASYIKVLSKIKYNKREYEVLSKNVSNFNSPYITIDWNSYLPS